MKGWMVRRRAPGGAIKGRHREAPGGVPSKWFLPSNSRTLRDINFKLGMLIDLDGRTYGIEDEYQGVP